jgi:hypothetical protein
MRCGRALGRRYGRARKPRGFGDSRPRKVKNPYHVGSTVMPVFSLRHIGLNVSEDGNLGTVEECVGDRCLVQFWNAVTRKPTDRGWVNVANLSPAYEGGRR